MLEVVLFIWFSLSVVLEVVSGFVLWLWLRTRGVKLVFSLIGVPGYLEHAYLVWCRSQGRSGRRLVVWRTISMINVVLAALITIPFLASE